MRDESPGAFTVVLRTAQGKTVGGGVLVGDRRILTCAHVVNSAMGRPKHEAAAPDGTVAIVFPFLAAPAQAAREYPARVAVWLPPRLAGSDVPGEDIAGLVIDGEAGPLPPEAHSARLAHQDPGAGLAVRVFGYPSSTVRERGAWVPAVVQGTVALPQRPGHAARPLIQLDGRRDNALRIQPGYSGFAVYDDNTDTVVGIVVQAPEGDSGFTDSLAVGAGQLREAWPDQLGGGSSAATPGGMSRLTLLHLSEIGFGRESNDVAYRRLPRDLKHLTAEDDVRPDVVVITGDLSSEAVDEQFQDAFGWVETVAHTAQIPIGNVAVVPGDLDVNLDACQAHFFGRRAKRQPPLPPYYEKWEAYASELGGFQERAADPDDRAVVSPAHFDPVEEWSLFEITDRGRGLRVVVAGLNSTMAQSHENAGEPGRLGYDPDPERQLRWFAERLAGYRDQGWLRIAAVHHNVLRDSPDPAGNLAAEDAAALDRILGVPRLLNVVLHGHGNDRPGGSRPSRLPSGVLVLGTGSPVQESGGIAHRCQLITIDADELTQGALRYEPGGDRWIGDNRISRTGRSWQRTDRHAFAGIAGTIIGAEPAAEAPRDEPAAPSPASAEPQEGSPLGALLRDVEEAARANLPEARVEAQGDCLWVTNPLPGGGFERWAVGARAGAVDKSTVDAFAAGAHRRIRQRDQGVRSELVYDGPAAAEEVVAYAWRKQIWLRSLVDYQGLVDLRPVVRLQRAQLAADRIYPASLYVPQRYRLPANDDSAPREDAAAQVVDWLNTPDARFVMILGDSGRGKTALLRRLARTLEEELPGVLPLLVDLRSLQGGLALEDLLAVDLAKREVTAPSGKMRYMLRRGRIVVLLDGFDELEQRVGYGNATDYLRTLSSAVAEQAKVVVSSRTQQFRGTTQVVKALGDGVAAARVTRILQLEDFTPKQIKAFLAKLFDGDDELAQRRYEALARVTNLVDLARNPRLLTMIADLAPRLLQEIEREGGTANPARLYQRLLGKWFAYEAKRQERPIGLPAFGAEERHVACTQLALRMWARNTSALALDDIAAYAATLTDLARLSYTPEEAAHAIGSGSILIRTDEETFEFVHPSVKEWLVAEAAVGELDRPGDSARAVLATHLLTDPAVGFFCDLAGGDRARAWAAQVLADPAAVEPAKQNALAVNDYLGAPAPARQALARLDLRKPERIGRDLRSADLRGAKLPQLLVDVDLTAADLRGVNLSRVRMVRGSLLGANLGDSDWHRAALLGVDGVDATASSLAGAAVVPGPEKPVASIAAGALPTAVAFVPAPAPATGQDDDVNGHRADEPTTHETILAVARGATVELVDRDDGTILRVLAGHADEVTHVASSLDGTRLASASRDRTAIVWDARTGHRMHTLTGHDDGLSAVVFAPAGGLVATASLDGTVRLWGPAGDFIRTLARHTKHVSAAAFSPDGTLLATGSLDRTARLWRTGTGELVRILPGDDEYLSAEVTSVAFAPHGRLLATALSSGGIAIWEVASGVRRKDPRGHAQHISTIAFTPGPQPVLATASHDGTVGLWNPETAGQIRRIRVRRRDQLGERADWVVGLAVDSRDPSVFATVSNNRSVQLWHAEKDEAQAEFVSYHHWVAGVRFDPAAAVPRLVTVSEDRTARVWTAGTGAVERIVGTHPDPLSAVDWSLDGTLLATASSARGRAWLWDGRTGEPRGELAGHGRRINAIAFAPDGSRLATASDDRTARIWSTAPPFESVKLVGHDGVLTTVAFAPDGTPAVATGSRDLTVRVWDTRTNGLTAVLKGHSQSVSAVAFHPAGDRLVSASWDGTVRVHTLGGDTRRLLGKQDKSSGVIAVAFAPSGDIIATGTRDAAVGLWDADDGTLIALDRRHKGPVTQVAFDPSGRLLASAAADNTVRLWRVRDGQEIAVLLSLPGDAYAVLLPDDSYKLVGDAVGALWWAVKLCRFAPGELDEWHPGLRRLPIDHPLFNLADLTG